MRAEIADLLGEVLGLILRMSTVGNRLISSLISSLLLGTNASFDSIYSSFNVFSIFLISRKTSRHIRTVTNKLSRASIQIKFEIGK